MLRIRGRTATTRSCDAQGKAASSPDAAAAEPTTSSSTAAAATVAREPSIVIAGCGLKPWGRRRGGGRKSERRGATRKLGS